MSTDKHSSWSYAEALPLEDEVLARARERGYELGVTPVGTGAAALLTVLAAHSSARTAVEIGAGVGVSGVSLLRGFSAQTVFTTIDVDVDHLSAARQAYAEAGIPASRTRTISGRAKDVLPRLTTGAYDFVLIDADKGGVIEYVEHAIRLLRGGGMLVLHDALDADKVPLPAVRQPSTVAARQAGRILREHDDVVSALVPTGPGLFLAVKQ